MDNFWCFSDAEISLPTARETGRRFVNSIVFLSYLKVDGIQKKTKSYFPNWLTDWECAVVTFKTSAIDLNGFSLEQRLVRPCYSRYLKIPRSLHGHLLKKDHNVALVLDVKETCGGDDARTAPAASTCHQLPVTGYDRKRKEREECPNRQREQEGGNEEAKSQESHQVRTEGDSRYSYHFEGHVPYFIRDSYSSHSRKMHKMNQIEHRFLPGGPWIPKGSVERV